MDPVYSVVVPLKDEEANVEELILATEKVMVKQEAPFEMICIDDGSKDGTLLKLQLMKTGRPWLRVIIFEKNFGQSSAFDAGFKAAKGEAVITLDGDLQNDPADIPKLLELYRQGYDLVAGWRKSRKDPLSKKVISKCANFIRSRFLQDGINDTGCSLKIYRRESLLSIKMFNGMHRFLPALFKIEGYKVIQVPVSHRERKAGKTKYNIFNRSLNTLSDLFAVSWMRKRHLGYRIKSEIS